MRLSSVIPSEPHGDGRLAAAGAAVLDQQAWSTAGSWELQRSSPKLPPVPVYILVERFDRRGTEPFELFRSEFGKNSFKIGKKKKEKKKKNLFVFLPTSFTKISLENC